MERLFIRAESIQPVYPSCPNTKCQKDPDIFRKALHINCISRYLKKCAISYSNKQIYYLRQKSRLLVDARRKQQKIPLQIQYRVTERGNI
ncbi:hypothetical protein CEXT_757111 [Caerostris extrusa]|uniref:Uncharacterized protein n=1 Tax=Caerostris extrusa TaxID=172846 RepID=A0AAV4V840_CAEEX|nr:hypothetical protein CEXT_757111 [Caerostris extrusa]